MASNDEDLISDDDDLASGSTKTAARRDAGDADDGKRPGVFKRMARFLREVRSELRKVAWPTRSETINYSVIVLVSLVFMTTLIFLVDLGFSEVVLRLFNAK